MQKQQYRISIDAPKDKVWETLWGEKTYSHWTAPFTEGSTVKTDSYKVGSKALFLDGKGNGMVSIIDDNRPNEFMSFRHIGEVKNGVEDTTSDRVTQWSGAHENYTVSESGGKTEVVVEMDITPEFAEMFANIWPKALAKLKEIAEKS